MSFSENESGTVALPHEPPTKRLPTAAGAEQFLQGRLQSLDFFRGLTMFLLIGESARAYLFFKAPWASDTWLATLGEQFEHHPWAGLHAWDLIQPFFMFIVGVAMPFSFAKRWEQGQSWGQSFRHALLRSALLLALGCAIPCI